MTQISWADINKDGRRLERVIKMMETKAIEAEDKDMQLAYVDRLIKATTAKVHIAEIVLNIKRLLAESTREIKPPIGVINAAK